MKNSKISITKPHDDYELLDSGLGEKLERFGSHILSRPDPQALWQKKLPKSHWDKAEGRFIRESERGEWSLKTSLPSKWEVNLAGIKFWVKPTPFKHVGLFPEHMENWLWLEKTIKNSLSKGNRQSVEVLNLFGYTGGASLVCAKAGAKVTHIDSSKSAVSWARENAELSNLAQKPIRWIVEDARLFVERELRRGNHYDAIIMDPPAFGHGADNELWKIEKDLLPLIENCAKLLSTNPLFFLINGYSAGYSALAYENVLLPIVEKHKGEIEMGELAIAESGEGCRLLPAGIFARWFVL